MYELQFIYTFLILKMAIIRAYYKRIEIYYIVSKHG